MRLGVVGYGVVGQHVADDIDAAGHIPVTLDAKWELDKFPMFKQQVNSCDASFVCVPTPMAADGSCDLTAINDVFSWLRTPVIIIRSTVPPGTTAEIAFYLRTQGAKSQVVFVPEFIGEGVNAPYLQMKQPPFLIIGGDLEARADAYQILSKLYNSECEFIYTDSTTAECIKYGENAFLAMRVTFFNEWFDICAKVGADFGQFVNGLTHDYRIGKSHSHVYRDARGWSNSRCLPKDLNALLHLVGEDTAPLLASLIRVNARGK